MKYIKLKMKNQRTGKSREWHNVKKVHFIGETWMITFLSDEYELVNKEWQITIILIKEQQ